MKFSNRKRRQAPTIIIISLIPAVWEILKHRKAGPAEKA